MNVLLTSLGMACLLMGADDVYEVQSKLDRDLTSQAESVARELMETGLIDAAIDVPEFHRIDEDEFAILAANRNASHRFRECCFDTKSNRVYVLRRAKIGASLARLGQQIEALRWVAIAHELVHVWQFVHVVKAMPDRNERDGLVMYAILEGQAQSIALRYAAKLNVAEPMARARLDSRRANVDYQTQFIYEVGLKFWEALVARNPKVHLRDVLADRNVSQRTIAYPGAVPTDLQKPPTGLSSLLEHDQKVSIETIDFPGFRRFVKDLDRPAEYEQICRSYAVGWRVIGTDQSAAVSRFDSERDAAALLRSLKSTFEMKLRPETGRWRGDIVGVGFEQPKTDSSRRRYSMIIQDAQWIIEFNDARDASTMQELGNWMNDTAARYLAVQQSLTEKAESP